MTLADDQLDTVFKALADPTRRLILTRLSEGDATVNEIAAPLPMSQPAVSKHLKVLERAGLIERGVDEQRRPARLNARNMNSAVAYINQFKTFWEGNFDELGLVLEAMTRPEKNQPKKKQISSTASKQELPKRKQ